MENRIKITQFNGRDPKRNLFWMVFDWGRMLEHLESEGVKMTSGDPTKEHHLDYGRFHIWNCKSGWAVAEKNNERHYNHLYFNKGWKDHWCLYDWDDLENAINYVVDTEKMVSHHWDNPHNCRMIDDVMRLVHSTNEYCRLTAFRETERLLEYRYFFVGNPERLPISPNHFYGFSSIEKAVEAAKDYSVEKYSINQTVAITTAREKRLNG